MTDLAPPASSVRGAATAVLNQTRNALDGIPAEELLNDCLLASARDRGAGIRAQRLADHILAQWVAVIERDLAGFPPSSMDVMQQMQDRMLETRDALLRLRWLLHDLNGQTTRAAPDSASTAKPNPLEQTSFANMRPGRPTAAHRPRRS